MEEEKFVYENKTAIQSLQELCLIRKYPTPLYLDRSQLNKIMVTTVVGGKIYGSAEGKSVAEACELAAIATLKIWLKDSFDSSLLLQKSSERIEETHVNNTTSIGSNNSQSDSQLNSVSLLHVFITSILHDSSSKPEYIVNKLDDKFFCELTLLHEGKTIKTCGDGKTKVLAKRVAAFAMLQQFFPNLHTLEQFSDSITAAIESKKVDKKTSKSTKKLNIAKDLTVTAPVQLISQHIPDTKDELTDTVYSVISNLQKFNISPPSNYNFRVAIAEDVDSILNLIKELAIYEQSVDSMSMTREVLLRDGFGVNRKYPNSTFRPDFYVYLVEYQSAGVKTPVGMALFYQVYSTWKGRSIHLEDLFVVESHRAAGLGTILMRLVGAVVDEMNMTRYGWVCLHWNEKPRRFYNSLGTTELTEWISIRMEDESIKKFVYNGRESSSVSVTSNSDLLSPLNSTASWKDRFAEARKIGNECDKDVVNFHPISERTKELVEDEEALDDSGMVLEEVDIKRSRGDSPSSMEPKFS